MGNADSADLKESVRFKIYSQSKQTTLLQEKSTGDELCLREIVFHSSKQLQEFQQYLSGRVDRTHRHLIQLREVKVMSNFQLCTNLYRMQVLFEHPFKTLGDEIGQRKASAVYFKENQILSILYSCLMGLKQLNSLGIEHHCIRSDKIFISMDGFIKLSQPKLFQQLPNLDLARTESSNPNLFLSPEQINLLLNTKSEDLSKADIFTLGMIILEVISLTSPKQFYSLDYSGMIRDKLESFIDAISIRYSYKLKDIIGAMLNEDTATRVDLDRLIKMIQEKAPLGQVTESQVSRNIQESANRFSQVNRFGKQDLGLNMSSLPGLNFVRNPKQNYAINNGLPQFPSPHRATVWVNKGSHSPETRRKVIKIVPNRIEVPPTTPPVVALPIPLPLTTTNRPNHSPQLAKFQGLVNFETMRHEIQQLQSASKQCLQSLKSYEYSNHQMSVSPAQPRQSIYSSNHTISEVTEPDCSELDEIRAVNQKYAEGSYYQGQKMGSMRHGKGKFFYKDGGYYDGYWRFDKMNGQGKLYYQNGNIAYDGNWKDDQFHGFGKVYNDQPNSHLATSFKSLDFSMLEDFWFYYQGQFVKDTKHGHGRVMLTNGEVFEGAFVDDAVHGQGEFHTLAGSVVRGLWNDNKFSLA